MRIAITGAAGLFGHGLVAAFSSRHTVIPLTRADAATLLPEEKELVRRAKARL